MIGRREFAVSGISLGAAAALSGASRAQGAGADHHAMPTEVHEKCAEACSDCQRVCDACATHCAHQLHAGKKEHIDGLMHCRDCADFCAASAAIVARGGPFAKEICTGCAEACAKCGAVCEKFADDAHMKKCAEECRKCEKACREMLAHI
jgi:hypothetical protein